MQVISTVGHPNANSFMSMSDADAFMLLQDAEWATRTLSERTALIIMSAGDISRINFLGTTWFLGQALAFPRRGDALVTHYALSEGITRVEKIVVSNEMVETPAQLANRLVHPVLTSVVFDVPTGYTLPNADSLRTVMLESEPGATLVDGVEVRTIHTIIETEAGVWGEATATKVYTDGSISPVTENGNIHVVLKGSKLTVSLLHSDTPSAPDASYIFSGSISRKVLSPVERTVLVPNQVKVGGLVLAGREDVYPDFAVGGSVHVMMEGMRAYFDILEHNIATGVLTLSADLPDWEDATFVYFDPHLPNVVGAQKIQLLVRAGVYDEDPYAGTDITSIKIGDSTRTYGGPRYGKVSLAQLATRNKVVEQVFVLIGQYTTYGKYAVMSQQQLEDGMASPDEAQL